jgi:hypothetical protein
MNKKDRRNYFVAITVYVLVRIIILIKDGNLSFSYFIENELSGVIGFVIGWTLFYYFGVKKTRE